LEHSFRFLKGDLNGVTPRVRLPEQADPWTWLPPAAATPPPPARPPRGAGPGGRAAPALGAPAGARAPHAGAAAAGFFDPAADPGPPRGGAKTLRALARPPQRPPLTARRPLSPVQEARPAAPEAHASGLTAQLP